jgi:hypothetical protein
MSENSLQDEVPKCRPRAGVVSNLLSDFGFGESTFCFEQKCVYFGCDVDCFSVCRPRLRSNLQIREKGKPCKNATKGLSRQLRLVCKFSCLVWAIIEICSNIFERILCASLAQEGFSFALHGYVFRLKGQTRHSNLSSAINEPIL